MGMSIVGSQEVRLGRLGDQNHQNTFEVSGLRSFGHYLSAILARHIEVESV